VAVNCRFVAEALVALARLTLPLRMESSGVMNATRGERRFLGVRCLLRRDLKDLADQFGTIIFVQRSVSARTICDESV
jgi:hypothetical protein